MKFDLHQALHRLNLDADWVGIRQVNEKTTTHAVRDGRPQSNGRDFTQGVMVEVLAQGQFGYAATNRLDQASLQLAAEQAYQQAISTSWPFTFSLLRSAPK